MKRCEICGKVIEDENKQEKWLLGFAHNHCKKKEEGKIKERSETIYRKKEEK